ncbi:hypothetical protein ENBRE01_0721 [Enteropsectra breve]|nr:hypothetical protein ENBRE01_0721 [Enteropsectra breve]
MRIISGVIVLLSHLTATSDMMLAKISVLEDRIKNEKRCDMCEKSISYSANCLFSAPEAENEYTNYSPSYFCCPKCEQVAHIDCFLKSGRNEPAYQEKKETPKDLKCPNPECLLLFKSNDLIRLFAQLIYTCVSKREYADNIEQYFKSYFPVKNSMPPYIYLDFLIESSTIPEFGTKMLRDLLIAYDASLHKNAAQSKLSYAFKMLDKAFPRFLPHSEKQEYISRLNEQAFLLYKSQNMWDRLCECSSPSEVYSTFEAYVCKASSLYLKEQLSNLFMYFVMRKENSFKFMEEIYYAAIRNANLPKNIPLKSELSNYSDEHPVVCGLLSCMLNELQKNNNFTITSKIDIYLKNENQGAFIPVFNNYSATDGKEDKADENAE